MVGDDVAADRPQAGIDGMLRRLGLDAYVGAAGAELGLDGAAGNRYLAYLSLARIDPHIGAVRFLSIKIVLYITTSDLQIAHAATL